MEPFIHHIPHTHGQVIPVTTVQRHALKAVAVVRAGLLQGQWSPLSRTCFRNSRLMAMASAWRPSRSSSFCSIASSLPSIFSVRFLLKCKDLTDSVNVHSSGCERSIA